MIIPWETPRIEHVLSSEYIIWCNIYFGELVISIFKYFEVYYIELIKPRRIISDTTFGQSICKISDHPELLAMTKQFCGSGDPVCFAAIYDYLVENIPEFLEIP